VDLLLAAKNYIRYRLLAGTPHDVHSPFVFELLNNVIRDETPYYGFDLVESLRSKHLLDGKKISITDYGTGQKHRQEKISDIAKRSVKPRKYAQLLFRLVNRFQSQNILEIGTSLGLTTLYLSLPKKDSRVVTLEGCKELSELARQNFSKLKRSNIELIEGDFGDTLPSTLKKFDRLDFVYFDGNHRKDATLSYFRQCLPLAHADTVFVFDDIHWSREMEVAWNEITADPKVKVSIDLFQLGIVFFRNGIIKQHFVLKY
jgi:predicted O-methyltransferase YrrM